MNEWKKKQAGKNGFISVLPLIWDPNKQNYQTNNKKSRTAQFNLSIFFLALKHRRSHTP